MNEIYKQGKLFQIEDDKQEYIAGVSNRFTPESYSFDNMSLLTQINRGRDRKDTIKKAREFVWTTGLLYRLVKLKVDFICSGFEPIHEDKKVEKYYKQLYRKLKMNRFIKNFAFENEVVGEVYPFYNWDNREPNNISILNPEFVKVETALGEDFIYLYPSTAISNLLNSDEPEVRNRLRKLIPTKVLRKWETGNPILLDKENSRRYYSLKAYHERYAHSPLEPIFDDLMLLQELIDADYAVAKKIKNLITHVQIGNKEINNGIAPKELIEGVEALFNNPNGRTLDLFTQWFVNIEYPLPPIKEIFASEKYRDVVQRIIDWSGMSVFFNTDSSSYSGGYIKIKPAKQEVENGREVIKDALYDFNLMVAKKQGFKTYNGYKVPEIRFNNNALTDENFMLEVSKFLFSYGLMSEEQASEEFGYDFVRQMKKKKENAKYADNIKLHWEPSQGGTLEEEQNDSNNDEVETEDSKDQPRP